jgi:hypothetical protein
MSGSLLYNSWRISYDKKFLPKNDFVFGHIVDNDIRVFND